jgi:transcriptional regulator with XRE-family HTH domain
MSDEQEFLKKIYENIKNFRELKKVTREHLASDLDISVSGYGKIERGEVDVSISKLYKIANILGVTLEQILNFEVASIFNYHDSQVQTYNTKPKMIIHTDTYLEKYVKILEQEVERLKKNNAES